jgi:hypothetical protein
MALLAPSGALAATVVNGDFESGSLRGWHVRQATEAGDWFAYEGAGEPIADKRAGKPIQPPPQGAHAAIADELNPDTLILFQDVALEPGLSHRLSLLAYYDSYVPLAVPTPDTLSVDGEGLAGQANQQYRIDVMKPDAPIESVDPADILLTVFRTRPGDPEELPPTRLTADLSPFAGQTVRLRIAVAAHEEVLAAGVDAVSISSVPPGQSQPGGSKPRGATRFSFGKVKLNRSNGTATLPVQVPGSGQLTAKDAPASGSSAGASKARKRRKLIKPVSARAAAAETVTIRLKPTPPALATLKRKHKLRVKVAVTYAPSAGPKETASVPVVLKLKVGPHRRR